uniref:ATP synthase subunit gamma n=1 Tax=Haptolina ericina TaxID=156174 RepID=A0A7S3EZF3_9EUKA
MKVVASVKLKIAQRKMDEGRPFAASISSIMGPVLTPDDEYKAETPMLQAISTDKGLCGGINSRIVKEVKVTLDAAEAAGSPIPTLNVLGSKGVSGLQRTHGSYIAQSIDETYAGPITFSLASFLAEQMLTTPADKYSILYNKFTSVVAFDVTEISIKGPEALGESGVLDEYEFEGEKESILANMYQFNMACTLYGCLLENVTCEQASKMTAMENASNNATEMIDKLRLKYNRQRQAVITTELTEIVAGAESV